MKTLPFYLLMAALSIYAFPAKAGGPVAVPDDIVLQLNSDVITVDVLQNDNLNGNEDITLKLLSQPEFGTATVDDKTNQIIFQTQDNQGGEISFQYEVCGFSPQCGTTCSTTEVKIEVLNMPVVPEGLTLNGDGFNEGLKLTSIKGYNRLELTIVNRWGHMVYRNLNYDTINDPWRGTLGNSEEQVRPGVYYYYLTAFRDGRAFETQTSALYIFR